MDHIHLFLLQISVLQRPEKYLGDLATWEKAEASLTEALNEFGKPWQVNIYITFSQFINGVSWSLFYTSFCW